jgi:glycosyltransferase involved in cell wall biosynthesis
MRLMAERKILFISKRSSAASSRYRAEQYAGLFGESGWLFRHIADDRSFSTRKKILQEARSAQVVVVVRRIYSFLFLNLLRIASKHLVFDFDDAVFQKDDGRRSSGREKKFARIVSVADQVWAGNNFLAEKAGNFCNRVLVLPTALDVDKYNIVCDKPDGVFDLVWIGSSATKKHLTSALPAFEEAARLIPALRLKIIADFTLDTDVIKIVPIPWSEEFEAQEIATSHVGVAPLPDNLYTKGKCALKVIQYMAASLPVISSSTGVNEEIIQATSNGLLCENKQEWVEAICRLHKDKELRLKMGERGQRLCHENFSLQASFQKMIQSLG